MGKSGHIPVVSDVAPLKRAIVHRPGSEIFKVLAVSPHEHPMLPPDLMGAAGIEQHEAFVRLLQARGVEVLFLQDLLDDAIARAHAQGRLAPWLRANAPAVHRALNGRVGALTGADLLGATDALVYRTGAAGNPSPLLAPMKWMFYTRDLAVTTPRGLIRCNFLGHDRAFEARLAGFVLDHARALQAYPVAFDAVEEQVYLQGGDVIVADAHTLFVGIGNLTEERAARVLARRLGMDVVGVRLPGGGCFERGHAYDHWTGLHRLLPHLDSCFAFVDTDKVLALPYFFEARHAARDPLTRILAGLCDAPGVDADRIQAVIGDLQEVGWVRVYKANSGELDTNVQGMKLVDYMRIKGYKVIPVGGAQAGLDEHAYVVERVLRELRFQAANVLATAPGKLIAYAGNPHTLAALRAAGLEVTTFAAHELVRWSGGPHRMTMPLSRTPS